MSTPRALLRAELSAVVTDLWFEIDHRDGAAAADFFTADARLTFSRHTLRGRDEIAAVYRTRAARGPRVSRHLVSNLHVVRHDLDTAETLSVLVLHAADGAAPIPSTAPLLVADVHDHFVRAGPPPDDRPGWLIASRHIHHRFVAPGAVLAVPTDLEQPS